MRILIVDDEQTARYGIRRALEGQGEISQARSLKEARKMVQQESPELVLLDLNLDGEDGFELLGELQRKEHPALTVIITAHGNEKIAVQAIKTGAFDYLAKPFDLNELRLVVRNAAEQIRLRSENRRLESELVAARGYGQMIGSAESMQQLFRIIDRVAPTDVTVLLTGESGSGKELVARELHTRSSRGKGPMICLNCASIPENLLESELFGHEKGAFTGAVVRQMGKFEQANRGTLFLDEIGDMTLETQAKILRALEERIIQRLGSSRALAIDVRIVSATNRDLENMVEEGTFREDLYYRLKVVHARVPPLRERKADIPALVDYFLEVFSVRHRKQRPKISDSAMVRLVSYRFPGNVRELRNLTERLLVLDETGTIEEHNLPQSVRFASIESKIQSPDSKGYLGLDFKIARQTFERNYLLEKLKEHGNNITHTAEAIGIHRQSLQQKIRDLGLREDLK